MKRREVELFNISFLDILTGALGAVLFLFIVVPKGEGAGPSSHPQINLALDTIQNKFFRELPDSLRNSDAGDTLLSVVFNYARMPSIMDCPEPKPCPKTANIKEMKRYIARIESELSHYKIKNQKLKSKKSSIKSNSKSKVMTKKTVATIANNKPTSSSYKGDLPSVPCKFSVEIKWDDINDNVDLFLCKDGKCVYGGKRRRKAIGFWDSGKSKTNIFGGDLRTTQEAIRQFDAIIPGSYNVYAQYKGANSTPKPLVKITGLVFSKTKENGEKAKIFSHNLRFNKRERTLLGSIELQANGNFKFNQKK